MRKRKLRLHICSNGLRCGWIGFTFVKIESESISFVCCFVEVFLYFPLLHAIWGGGLLAQIDWWNSILFCCCCMNLKPYFHSICSREIDIPHGIGGLLGTILFGVFASPAFCEMPYPRGEQLLVQAGGACISV